MSSLDYMTLVWYDIYIFPKNEFNRDGFLATSYKITLLGGFPTGLHMRFTSNSLILSSNPVCYDNMEKMISLIIYSSYSKWDEGWED